MSDLSLLWNARSIAVIGATERAGALGRKPVDYLRRYGYPGLVLPIKQRGRGGPHRRVERAEVAAGPRPRHGVSTVDPASPGRSVAVRTEPQVNGSERPRRRPLSR